MKHRARKDGKTGNLTEKTPLTTSMDAAMDAVAARGKNQVRMGDRAGAYVVTIDGRRLPASCYDANRADILVEA